MVQLEPMLQLEPVVLSRLQRVLSGLQM
ncbi:hypothetical protein A2U01_0095537, partial [Trifolium medium]|nr:hypothetical protein [Trifolium medium]